MDRFTIDEITWHDLSMDNVLESFDTSESSVGKEYIENTFKTLLFDENTLEERSLRSDWFSENNADASKLKKIFKGLGRTKKVSFYDYIFRLKELPAGGSGMHYLLILLLFAAVASIFIKPAIGIIALVVMVSVNIVVYFRKKAQIEGYFMSLKYLVSMINTAEAVISKCKLDNEAFSGIKDDLKNSVKALKALKRGSWLITNSVSGSLADVVMDYIRMIFHVDIIKFNQMKKRALGHESEINALYNGLGEIELALALSRFRASLAYYCKPSFDKKVSLEALDVYHPLVKSPVANSIDAERSVLLTGSNASGKSTFLKTLALNQIFAQTIYTCLAKDWHSDMFKVYSSMALSDNILGKESYFVVEIKSLKRIFDAVSDTPILCFIDEVLRGTNTKERIATSSQILKKLSGSNALVFAATHDIELTELLSEYMTNMHFTETVTEAEVKFDYKLKKGPANSRNAIKLLSVYGFDKEIVEAAEKLCLP